MEVSYKQDITHSFLVIQPDREVDTKAYPLRMVLGNAIPGLLSCKLQKVDGKVLFYYDVTACQKMSNIYEKMTYEKLRKIYQGLFHIFEQMNGYLLDARQLILNPEYIYLNKEEGDLHLCYLPGYEKPVQEQLRFFTEYLLPHIEHQDSRGVMLGYGFYRLLVEDNFQMETFGEILQKSELQQKDEENDSTEIQWDSEVFTDEYKDVQMVKESKKEGAKRKDAVLLLAGLLLMGGFILLRQIGYFSWITVPVLLVVFLSLIFGVALLLWKEKRKEQRQESEVPCINKRSSEEKLSWKTEMCPPQNTESDNLHINGEKSGKEMVILNRSLESEYPVLMSEEAGQAPPIRLVRDMTVVGKMESVSDVLLKQPSISLVHARIQKKGQDYWITDLNSENGTFVNGKKLEKGEEYLLQAEDQVFFADLGYRFVEPEASS